MHAGVVVARLIVQKNVPRWVKSASELNLRKGGGLAHLLGTGLDEGWGLFPLRQPSLLVFGALLLPKAQLDARHNAANGRQMRENSTNHTADTARHHTNPLY
jgi:hypothetical protein